MFQLSMPSGNESVVYEAGVVSIDIKKQEVKTSGIAFELSDAAIGRLVTNCSVTLPKNQHFCCKHLVSSDGLYSINTYP